MTDKKVRDRMSKRIKRLDRLYSKYYKTFRLNDGTIVVAFKSECDLSKISKWMNFEKIEGRYEGGVLYTDTGYHHVFTDDDLDRIAYEVGFITIPQESTESTEPIDEEDEEDEEENDSSSAEKGVFDLLDYTEAEKDFIRIIHALKTYFEKYRGVGFGDVLKKAGLSHIDRNTRLIDICRILSMTGYRLSLHKSLEDTGIFKRRNGV